MVAQDWEISKQSMLVQHYSPEGFPRGLRGADLAYHSF